MELEGQVVVVPGSTGGVGPSIVRSSPRARLVVSGRDRGSVEALLAAEKLDPALHLARPGDVTTAEGASDLVSAAEARFGRVDGLVNVVGAFRGGKAVHESNEEDFEAMMSVNVRSVFLMSRAVVPLFLAQGSGSIVSIGSRAALHAEAGSGLYAAAKSAVLRLTEAMAAELGPRGIRVNAIVPGTIDTKANRTAMPDADRSHWVRPEDLAQVVAFLVSPTARAVNGAFIPLDGTGGAV